MSRRSLYRLEMEFSRTLKVWDRTKARKTSAKISFRPAYLLPPEELPIQGLMMPPKRKHEEERKCPLNGHLDAKRRFRRNAVKAKRKPIRRIRRNNVKMRGKPRFFNGGGSLFCGWCDYRDSLTNRCLIIRLGGECPYKNGVYFYTSKNAVEIHARSL